MNKENKRILEIDFEESSISKRYFFIRLKLLYYLFQRPFFDFWLKAALFSKIPPFFRKMFLLNKEGGMFKSWVYFLCNKNHSLKDACILIPGVGFGHCVFQLAAFKPKKIIAFDIYKYKEEWDFISKICKEKFGVNVFFYEGDFKNISDEKFDWIITDAVLEHVQDMNIFLENSNKFLRDGGWFYASFGPIWYGPGGDHIDWGGVSTRWDHLILEEREYEKKFNKKGEKAEDGTLQADFLFRGKLFSYLKAEEYFQKFQNSKFEFKFGAIKIDSSAQKYLKNNIQLSQELDRHNVPPFDRFVTGFLVWLRKKS